MKTIKDFEYIVRCKNYAGQDGAFRWRAVASKFIIEQRGYCFTVQSCKNHFRIFAKENGLKNYKFE